jgi:hypothetical protein
MSKQVNKVVELLDNYKAKAAFAVPFLSGLSVMVVNWIESSAWDGAEFRILLGGLATGVFTSVITWFTPAGNAVVELIPGTEINDDEPAPEGDVMKFGQE